MHLTVDQEPCTKAKKSGRTFFLKSAHEFDHSGRTDLFLAATCRSRIRHQAAAGSWTMPRQWEIQRTWLNSARAAVRSPAKSNGVWVANC